MPCAGAAGLRMAREDYDGALADYDAAICPSPEEDFTYRLRGNLFRARGEPARALSDYDAAIAHDPDDAWHFACRGRAYVMLGRFDEALADFDRAIALDPDEAEFLSDRNAARVQAGGDDAAAIRDAEAALAPGRDHLDDRQVRARSRLRSEGAAASTLPGSDLAQPEPPVSPRGTSEGEA